MIEQLKNIGQKIRQKISRLFKPKQINQLNQAEQEDQANDSEREDNIDNLLSQLISSPARKSIKAKKKHDITIMIALSVVFTIILIWLKYKANQADNIAMINDTNGKSPLNLEVASNALDIDKMWRNHFEDKLMESKVKADQKLQLIENNINEQTVTYQNQLKNEIEKLKAQIQFLVEEQASARRDIEFKLASQRQDADNHQSSTNQQLTDSQINVNRMNRGERFDRPKSARNFIPETGYVKGVLLGGIAVSTSIGSSSEPVPVIIRITDRGNLPKNFNIDLTHCQIMGSSYGDLSSERAVVRAEVLSCKDEVNELIYTTKIAGIIFGDDGMNGIKGKVVQTSGKHLKNAMLGSMISGFGQIAERQEQLSVTSLGAVSTNQQSLGQLAQNGVLAGTSSAAEKIADYYIKQAETMSPILLISGGTKVDVVFTKGVYLGELDIEEKLEILRNDQGKK